VSDDTGSARGRRRGGLAAALALLVVLPACGAAPKPKVELPPALPYRPVAVPRAITDADVAEARSTYGGIPVAAPERGPFRRAILDFELERVERGLKRNRLEAAFTAFGECLTLFDPVELTGKLNEPRLAQAARAIARAFARSGATREVLTGLTVALTLGGNDPKVANQIEEIHGWLNDAGRGDAPGVRAQRMIDDYEAIVRLWPSSPAIERLHALYVGRQAAMAGMRGGLGGGGGIREMLAAHASLLRTGFNLARLYLRIDRPEQALQALKAGANQPGEDPDLMQALEKALAPDATAQEWLAVARRMGISAAQRQNQVPERGADLDASLRVCRRVMDRYPREIMGYLCAGEMAFHSGRRGLAVRVFEAAQTLDPARREPYDALSILYYQRFRGRLSEEMLADAKTEVANLEKLHAEVKRRWPDQALQPPLAASYLELGRGFYNFGRADEAIALFERSLALEPLAEAYEQLGLTLVKKGEPDRAIQSFEKAAAMPQQSRERKRAWEARVLRMIGDAQDWARKPDAAAASWRASRAIWEELLQTTGPQDERLPDMLSELGRIHVSLGDIDEGVRSFERAVDTDPTRAETYVDALAFLAQRGVLQPLIAILHRALARSDAEVSEYFKVYAAFWVLDLLRLRGLPPDGLTRAYLEQLDGSRWYHHLARLVLGRATATELEAKADAPGKKAELFFYESMRRLATGDKQAAMELWQKVLGTGMMGYFEYDMSAYYLRHGPPLADPKPAPRPAVPRRPPPPPQRLPRGTTDGSL
jgi:tetratricopeptide (TPR) repeat protein